jgi:hypothetical protein
MSKTTDPKCKTAVNWITENIRRMVRKRTLERWKTMFANCEVTPQVIRPTAKSLTKTGGPKAPTAIHGPVGPLFYPTDKANAIADCLQDQFTAHNL